MVLKVLFGLKEPDSSVIHNTNREPLIGLGGRKQSASKRYCAYMLFS